MEPIFKVGDIVRIANLKLLRDFDVPFGTNSDMEGLRGEKAIIKAVQEKDYDLKNYPTTFIDGYNPTDGCAYELKPLSEDACENPFSLWTWSSPMLEKVGSEITLSEILGKSSSNGTTPLKIKVTRKLIVLNFIN